MVDKRECKTPGSIYHIGIRTREVSCNVALPMDLGISEEEAKDLEEQIHDAMEGVLAKYFEERA